MHRFYQFVHIKMYIKEGNKNSILNKLVPR